MPWEHKCLLGHNWKCTIQSYSSTFTLSISSPTKPITLTTSHSDRPLRTSFWGQELHKIQGDESCVSGTIARASLYMREEKLYPFSLPRGMWTLTITSCWCNQQSRIFSKCLSQSFLSKLLHMAWNNETYDGLYKGNNSIVNFGE